MPEYLAREVLVEEFSFRLKAHKKGAVPFFQRPQQRDPRRGKYTRLVIAAQDA